MNTNSPLRKIARIAGVLYLVIIIAGLFAEMAVRSNLIVAGDAVLLHLSAEHPATITAVRIVNATAALLTFMVISNRFPVGDSSFIYWL